MAPSERKQVAHTEQPNGLAPLTKDEWRAYRKQYNEIEFKRRHRVRRRLVIGAAIGSTPALVAGIVLLATGGAPAWLFALSIALLIPELAMCCGEAVHSARTHVRRGEVNHHLIEWVHAQRVNQQPPGRPACE